ncbi:MAG: CDP-diacylglycerol--glycerol-3-phosphate 3-phosphatidyltransferase [Clostridiales bacterium]|jgi:CDP-diacylglycerol--glycerol-3-phosphate 3-phosphatidyltransferase|nr:CDP-diacylglycerol--glycerol-3-phosphate 3-phosphatidyltransferase [Clostridiales bacterium]
MKKKIPNILTITRLIMCVALMITMQIAMKRFDLLDMMLKISLGIFVVASLTDWVDGFLARRWDAITNFGKIMDPLADKILVMTAFVGFAAMQVIPWWLVVIVLAREFLVTSLRIVAVSEGIVVPANMWGKLKTVSHMVAIIAVFIGIIYFRIPKVDLVVNILVALALVMTVFSGYEYCYSYIKHGGEKD